MKRMSFNTRILILSLMMSMTFAIHAQTAVWQMPPAPYEKISCVGNNLFEVQRGGKYGLIKADGSVVQNVVADNVGLFYEGRALVTVRERKDNRVLGVLTSDGTYSAFTQKYYTIENQEFYSDNLLTVKNDKGRVGYIDEFGNTILGFDGKYDNIKPFTEGFAAVFKNDEYSLINKRGVEAQMIIGVGEVYGGTNVCNGIAYIWDTDGKLFTYNVKTGECAKAKEPSDNQPDYLFCYNGVSRRGTTVPFKAISYEGVKGVQPYKSNGLYGYIVEDKIILPSQFDDATPFVDDYAVVKKNGQYGILKYVANSQSPSLTTPTAIVRYNVGSDAICSFTLNSLPVENASDLNISVTDDANNPIVVNSVDNGKYSFRIRPHDGSREYLVSVENSGLKLLEGKAVYTFKKNVAMLTAKIGVLTTKANTNDEIPVIATIINPNDESVTVEVRMTGSTCFVARSKTVTIPAKGSVQVSSVFKVKENVGNQHATVSTSKGGHATTGNLSLRAFY